MLQTRLTVHNLPKSCDDVTLKTMFGAAGEGPIKQVKVVRDDASVDAAGKPKSLGFGFVEFRDHQVLIL